MARHQPHQSGPSTLDPPRLYIYSSRADTRKTLSGGEAETRPRSPEREAQRAALYSSLHTAPKLKKNSTHAQHTQTVAAPLYLTRTNVIREGLPKGGHSGTHTRTVPCVTRHAHGSLLLLYSLYHRARLIFWLLLFRLMCGSLRGSRPGRYKPIICPRQAAARRRVALSVSRLVVTRRRAAAPTAARHAAAWGFEAGAAGERC